jgi:protein O-GlcNAc transferase
VLKNVIKGLLARREAAKPAPAESDFATAFRLYQEGKLDEAALACRLLARVPQPDVDFLRGLIEQARGDALAALAAFERAVAGRESEAGFHFGLAECLAGLDRQDAAAAHARRFLELAEAGDPRRARACMMLYLLHEGRGEQEDAQRTAERAIDAARNDAAVLTSLAMGFHDQSAVDHARRALDRRLALEDDYAARVRRAAMLPAIYDSRAQIDAVRRSLHADLDELLSRPAQPVSAPERSIGVLPFYVAYHNANNVELLRKFCAVARRAWRANTQGPDRARAPGRIRVGFVSTYFYSHSVGRATIGLIRDLPRERFGVHVFAIDPADDAMRAQIERAADRYHRLPQDLEAAREAIAAADLDALVFADIGMHPLTYFLALERLSPLQIAYWGHSETSGIDTVDYYLSADGTEIESAQAHYSEVLLRPKAFFLPGYERPPEVAGLARETLGLPRDRNLYACLQPAFKLHPDMDAMFGAILERDPRAEIVLVEARASWSARLRRRLARSLGPDARRVRFIAHMKDYRRFLATLAAVDVSLDPLYFGGCNSSCESMAIGVPVVTLPGEHLYGRFTVALYAEMGLTECVAQSPEDYIERAVRIAGDPERRRSLSAEILRRGEVLFDRRDLARELARFLEEKLAKSR